MIDHQKKHEFGFIFRKMIAKNRKIKNIQPEKGKKRKEQQRKAFYIYLIDKNIYFEIL